MANGKLIVLSGPSGSGKSTVISLLMAQRKNMRFSVSATTRPPRTGEVDGVDYFFITAPEFEAMIQEGAFLEHAVYVGNHYGTPRKAVEAQLEQGIDVILDIEVQGALQVVELMPDAISVFLMPPSFEELETRLIHRGKDPMEKIRQRLLRAREELKLANQYDYFVINDTAQAAADELNAIITAEKCKVAERKKIIEVLLK